MNNKTSDSDLEKRLDKLEEKAQQQKKIARKILDNLDLDKRKHKTRKSTN